MNQADENLDTQIRCLADFIEQWNGDSERFTKLSLVNPDVNITRIGWPFHGGWPVMVFGLDVTAKNASHSDDFVEFKTNLISSYQRAGRINEFTKSDPFIVCVHKMYHQIPRELSLLRKLWGQAQHVYNEDFEHAESPWYALSVGTNSEKGASVPARAYLDCKPGTGVPGDRPQFKKTTCSKPDFFEAWAYGTNDMPSEITQGYRCTDAGGFEESIVKLFRLNEWTRKFSASDPGSTANQRGRFSLGDLEI